MSIQYKKPLVKLIRSPYGYYLYETNQNKILRIQEALFQFIAAILEDNSEKVENAAPEVVEQYQNLQTLGYLSCNRVQQLEHPSTEILPCYLERKIDRITLQVTQQCNLRCAYCIYSESANLDHRAHSSKKLSLEMGKKAIDFYWKHSIDCSRVFVTFYGGEPLMEFQLVKELVEYTKMKFSGKAVSFAVTTNGTLLTDEIVAFLTKEHFFITISIDGPKDIHDQNRIFAHSNVGSFDNVHKNIEKIKYNYPQLAKNMALSMVINPQNDYLHINDLFKDPFLKNLSLTAAVVESDEQSTVFSQKYIDQACYQEFLSLLLHLENESDDCAARIAVEDFKVMDSRVQRLKESIPQKRGVPGGPCLAGKTRLFVDCDGNLFPCEHVSDSSQCMKIGTIESGFNYSQIQRLLNISQLTPKECKECWAAPLCNVCAKMADAHGELCAGKKLKSCEESKSNALSLLKFKILFTDSRIKNYRR